MMQDELLYLWIVSARTAKITVATYFPSDNINVCGIQVFRERSITRNMKLFAESEKR